MHNILVTPGDGIGPEVIDATRRVLDWYGKNRNFAFHVEEALVGGAAFEKTGRPDPDQTIEKAKRADALLFGAVGGPQWDKLPFAQKPERGLLRLRKDLELFANLRPALCFDALKDIYTRFNTVIDPVNGNSRKLVEKLEPLDFICCAECKTASQFASDVL